MDDPILYNTKCSYERSVQEFISNFLKSISDGEIFLQNDVQKNMLFHKYRSPSQL